MLALDILYIGIYSALTAVVVFGVVHFVRRAEEPMGARLEGAWSAVERFLIGILAFYALAQSFYESVNRYFFPELTTDWGLDLVIFALMWAVFVAGSGLVRDARHIRADLLIRTFPAKVQRCCEIFNASIGVIFGALFTYFGFRTVTFAYSFNEITESSLQFPVWIYYLGLPVGMFLMTLRYVIRLKIYLLKWDDATMAVGLNRVEAQD